MLKNNASSLCPCCSGMSYAACCQIFHEGTLPERAEQLMRARYSAYALNLPDYIMATTHPSNKQYSSDFLTWRKSLSEFSNNTLFEKLEIHHCTYNTVTFTAHLKQHGVDATFTEKSRFEKSGLQWLYVSGELARGRKPYL